MRAWTGGRQTVYGRGRGTTIGESRRDETGACDCSAFICWCLDIRTLEQALRDTPEGRGR